MWLVKENEGVILAAKVLPDGELSEWYPLGLGYKPILNTDTDGTYVLTLEYMGSIFIRALDKDVWPPNYVNPIEQHGSFLQLRDLVDDLSVSCISDTASSQLYWPVYNNPVRVKQVGALFYNPFTGTYTYGISLDLTNTTDMPSNVKAYQLYKRTNGGEWIPFGNPGLTEVTYLEEVIDLTADRYLSVEYGAAFFYGFNPNLPNTNSLSSVLVSNIGQFVLRIDKNTRTISSSSEDSLHISCDSNIRADTNVGLPRMLFIKSVAEDNLNISLVTNMTDGICEERRIFLAIGYLNGMADFLGKRIMEDTLAISQVMTTGNVVAFARA